jgi:hypothetical protein
MSNRLPARKGKGDQYYLGRYSLQAVAGRHGTPRTLQPRLQPSRTSPRTSSVRPPMRSRPPGLPHRKGRMSTQGNVSVSGSGISFRRRFARSCSTISGCATAFAGRCSTVKSVLGHQVVDGTKSRLHSLGCGAGSHGDGTRPSRAGAHRALISVRTRRGSGSRLAKGRKRTPSWSQQRARPMPAGPAVLQHRRPTAVAPNLGYTAYACMRRRDRH